jgi:hypothetical protein
MIDGQVSRIESRWVACTVQAIASDCRRIIIVLPKPETGLTEVRCLQAERLEGQTRGQMRSQSRSDGSLHIEGLVEQKVRNRVVDKSRNRVVVVHGAQGHSSCF